MLITNATLITWGKNNKILANQAVFLKNGKIDSFGPQLEMLEKHPSAEIVDAKGQLLMPGNICAHTHFYGMYARGMSIPGEAPINFKQILEKLWWPLDQALDEEAVRLSALVCLVDAIKHGTTTLIDHHASPNFLLGSLDAIAAEVVNSGLRAVLCYETTDRYGEEKTQQAIEENSAFIKNAPNQYGDTIRGTFGLHAPLTLSKKTLEACLKAAPADSGFHIHVCESTDDILKVSQETNGQSPLTWLNQIGILGSSSIVAHAVHITPADINLLAESKTWVTHQPRSNMNNAVGVAQVEAMLQAGVSVGLGNDGFSNSMWDEWKAAYMLHKINQQDPRAMNGYDIIKMGIQNNAALANQFFDNQKLGVIEAGAAADLILVDYHPPTTLTAENLPWHILFGFRDSMVTTTIVNGKVLMQDRQLLTLNEAEIAAHAREIAPRIWQQYNTFAKG